ncbi:MAG TPA: MBOAT family protein [Planctomycetota bacterium]|jgi:alginate O-acetyltransferase complex protein AlgI|nr:MBOAT family protein [Planctomycetota bacterium]
MNAWDRMLLAVAVTYLAFKTLTSRRLAFGRALGYWTLWPGMDARPFAETRPAPGAGLMAWGLCKMAVGAALLMLRTEVPALDVVRVFLGIGLLVHFGLCDVLAGFWRARGVTVERLFVNPAASRTLGEFWGRRWNRAFHAVAHEFVFRPVVRRWGAAAGVLATFLFSGLLHEVLISVPVGAGYGLPTAYFVLHGLLVLAERSWGLTGRVWTLFWVLAPLPLLFHPWFVRGIIVPLI